MKLSNLYTESQISEANPFKTLMRMAGRAFGKAKRNPNASFLRIQQAIDEVFKDMWANYHDDPKAQRRLEAYKSGSLQQHIPELVRIKDPQELRREIKKFLKKRAERTLSQQKDPVRPYRSLGLNQDQAERLSQREI